MKIKGEEDDERNIKVRQVRIRIGIYDFLF